MSTARSTRTADDDRVRVTTLAFEDGDETGKHRHEYDYLVVPVTGGTFTGPELNGTLLPGASADWQTVLPDGTALGDIRYTLQTDGGDLLYVRSRSVRHGPADVLARLGRGEEVDASLYTFRAATRIETAAPDLDWLNKGVFVSVGARRSGHGGDVHGDLWARRRARPRDRGRPPSRWRSLRGQHARG